MKIKSEMVRFALVGAVALFVSVLPAEKVFATAQSPKSSTETEEVKAPSVNIQNMDFLAPIVVAALTLSFAKGMSEKLTK